MKDNTKKLTSDGKYRADHLIAKLNNTNHLDKFEKIELRNILKKHKLGTDSVTAEYIGYTKSSSNGATLAFYILLILFLVLGIYTVLYANSAKKQITKLSEISNSQADTSKFLESKNSEQSKIINELNTKVNSLQSQLSQKPTTIYAPRTTNSSFRSPMYTSCRESFIGGFSCTTY